MEANVLTQELADLKPLSNTELVRRAAAGDQRGWSALVNRYTPLLWSVARAHRLCTADATDVVQTAWLRLLEHLDRLQDPERVGAWLATTVRRESLKVLRKTKREIATPEYCELDADTDTPERLVIEHETAELLQQAVAELPEQSQRFLRVLFTAPAPLYAEVAAALDMPIGSIGPTRVRVLNRLRVILARHG